MMLAASLVMSVTLGGFAAWLHYHEVGGWPEESDTPIDDNYRTSRRRRRGRIHALLLICSGLIAAAGISGQGRVWIACWMIVISILITIVFLAMLDALHTHRYFRQRRPMIRQEWLDGDH